MKRWKESGWKLIDVLLAATFLWGCGGGGGGINPGDATPPSIPQNLSAEVISSSRIDLSWSASTDDAGVAGYEVYRNGIQSLGSTAGTSYPAIGLTASTHYCFSVMAYDDAGNRSGMSDEICRTTAAASSDTQAPTVPTGLTANATSSSQISLSWNASTDNVGVTGYMIYRNGSYLKEVTTGTSTIDSGLAPSTQNCYQVSAIDAAGNESTRSTETCAIAPATSDTQAPTVPTGLTANATSSSQISLSWNASTDNVGVTGYRVYRGGTFLKTVATGTSTIDSGLSPSTSYCYQVSAIDAAENESANSAQVCAMTQAPPLTPPAAPSNLVATAASSSSINLAWSDNSASETGFKIERSTSPTTGFTLITSLGTNVTSYTNTGLAAATTYYYRVRAYNSAGDSGYSNTANAITQATPPAAPSNLVAAAASSSSINLTWTDNSVNETGFEIERSTSPTTGFAWIKTVGANVTSLSDTGLAAATTYYYRVRAYNSGGNSSYSNTATMTTHSSLTTITLPLLASNVVLYGSLNSTYENTVYQNYNPAVGMDHFWQAWGYASVGAVASLVKFNTSALVGKTIDSANLKLEVKTRGVGYWPKGFKIGTVATSWYPTTVTWNLWKNFNYYTASWQYFLSPYSGQIYNIDLKSTVQNWANGTWPNNGVSLISTEYTYQGNETSLDTHYFYMPSLTVTYR
jgi:chitodextrinase